MTECLGGGLDALTRTACGLCIHAGYMQCRQPYYVDEDHGVPAGRNPMAAGGVAMCGGGKGAVPGMLGTSRCDAGNLGSAQRAIGNPPQGRVSAKTLDPAAPPAPAAALRAIRARPELDDDHVGEYMRDAIGRGGYRAALEYYGSDEAKESDTPWHRLRARGWLLGRLGLYDQVQAWLEEVMPMSDFDHLSYALKPAPSARCRTPALWLETPRPVPRSTDHILTVEPVPSTDPDVRTVPGYIWTTMLILDATGPICSHAGIGAALSLVAAESDRRMGSPSRGDRRYDPLRGARLHGAPEGCQRWIIADIDFDPRPVNKPHYYYDLTDEGRHALDVVGRTSPPWPKAVKDAALGLEGMDLPDLLEKACGLGPVPERLDELRRDLGRVVGAWRDLAGGRRASPVGPEDQVLAGLGPPTRWHDADDDEGSLLDHVLHLMTAIESTHAMACEASPSARAERAMLQTLIGAIQGLCRRHGRAVAANASLVARTPASPGGQAGPSEAVPGRPLYADVLPTLISDMYYYLAEYCKSRRLAVDPCSLPLSKQLTADEKAAVIEILERDPLFYSDTVRSYRVK